MTRNVGNIPRIRPSLPTTPTAALVASGDVFAILAMLAAGLYRHSILAWEMPMYTLGTAAPFLLVWIVVAPLFGGYHAETLRSVRWSTLVVGGAWIVAVVLGAQLRATNYFHGQAPRSFVLVTIAFGLLFLLPWRLGWIIYRRQRHDGN